MKSDLQETLAFILDLFSEENKSNTPDFILAQYLIDCLKAYNKATNCRDKWYNEKSEIVSKEVDDET